MSHTKSTKAVGDDFALRVAATYRELGFVDVQEDVNLTGHAVDIVAKRHIPGVGLIIIGIECKTSISNGSRPIGKDQALKWANEVNDLRRSGRIHFATMVASQGFTRQAKEVLAANHVSALSFDELTASAIEFGPFAERYVYEYENWGKHPPNNFVIQALASSNLGEIFTQRSALLDPGGTEKALPDLDEYLIGKKDSKGEIVERGWVAQKSKDSASCIALLADFGMGKTSYLLHLTYALCKLWQKDNSWPVPLFVSLGRFPDPSDIRQTLLTAALHCGVSLSSVESLLRLVRAGRVLLIFDGVDETLTRGNFSVVRSYFEVFSAIAREDARCIVSCRSALFRDDVEMQRARVGHSSRPQTLLNTQFTGQAYVAVRLEKFTDRQVEEFVLKADSNSAKFVFDLIESNQSLAELGSTPVFLDMIIRTAPNLKGKSDVKVSSLYEIYANSWIHREDKANNSLSPQLKSLLLEELAHAVNDRRPPAMKASELRQFLQEQKQSGDLEQTFDTDDLDWLEHDMRTCAFLTRDKEGNYGFAHRSFQSYFLARRQLRKLSLASDAERVGDAIGDAPIGEMARVNFRRVTSHWGFLEEMLPDALVQKSLDLSHGATVEETGYACTNLVSLRMRVTDSIRQFSELPLPGLYCESQDLRGANFKNCDLRGALFHNCNLDEADFSGANLDDADIDACWLDGTRFDGAKLDECEVFAGVRAHALCASNDWLAIGGGGGEIQIFKGAQFARILRIHHDVVTALSIFSSRLASGGYADRSVIVTDLLTGEQVFRAEHPELANIQSVCFSADGKKLFYSEHFGTIFAVETTSWKQVWVKKFDRRLDKSFLLNDQLVVVHHDVVRLVSAETGDILRAFDIPEDYGREYAVSQRFLVSSYLPAEDAAYRVVVFDLLSGGRIAEWDCPYGLVVSSLIVSGDRIFVATEEDPTAVVGAGIRRVFEGVAVDGRARLEREEIPSPALFVMVVNGGTVNSELVVDEQIVEMADVGASILAATADGRILDISVTDLTWSMILTAGAFASRLSLAHAKGAEKFVTKLRLR